MTTDHKRMAVLSAMSGMISSLIVSNYEHVGRRDLEYYLSSHNINQPPSVGSARGRENFLTNEL